MTTFSRVIELHEDQYDPTYGSQEPGIFRVVICHDCGALVDDAATVKHIDFHEKKPDGHS